MGYDTDGFPLFVGLGPAASESTDAWDDFLADLTNLGLRGPLTQNPDPVPPLANTRSDDTGERQHGWTFSYESAG